ncbi:UNVERIFIED_CONTAM: ATP-dependent DNA helicase Q-like 2 [Sesamum radiatum]|uniref:DNA 3'-5' helicase n=1 Tax=Sesamum radiatum TaxID=300843 RepID=A0AAW2MEZ8_SESRA
MGRTEEMLTELLGVEMELRDVQEQIKMLLDQQEKLYERQAELKALLEHNESSRNNGDDEASVSVEKWSGPFEWDAEVDDVRFNVFGISSYRANQREIINAIMSGRDVLVIMAAGGGKSLCYQLPAVLRKGVALVVSPLLSLIQDQVMGLAALGIRACMLTSTTNKEDEKFIYKALEKGEGELKILYVTPEKISKSKRFMSKLEKCHHGGRLSLISIDSKRQCRRGAFFRHFAETLQDCNGMCDNCASYDEIKELDVSGHAKLIVSMLQEMQENDQRVTILQLVDKMKIKNKDLDPELKKEDLELLIVQLVVDRVLKEEFQHSAYATNAYVTTGPLAKQILHGKKTIKLEVRSGQKSSSTDSRTLKRGKSSGLEFKLDELRKELASVDGGIFPHSVLSTQQISMLSAKKPKSMEELEKIIGKLKAEKYGPKILEEINNYESNSSQMDDGFSGGRQDSQGRALKKLKTKKPVVVIESSGDEA